MVAVVARAKAAGGLHAPVGPGRESIAAPSRPKPAAAGPGGREIVPGMPIRRSLVARGTVYTVSDAGVLASSLDTLTERGWAGFPPDNGAAGTPKP